MSFPHHDDPGPFPLPDDESFPPSRDLASKELWLASLQRSRRRRVQAVDGRRRVARRKGASAVVSAAMLAGPTVQPLTAAAARTAGDDQAQGLPAEEGTAVRARTLLLQLGSRGPLVEQVQRALGIADDGIFGPRTDASVRDFQRRSGLAVDGIVGPDTWSALFEAAVRAASEGAGQRTEPAVGGDRSKRVLLVVEDTAPAPAGERERRRGGTTPAVGGGEEEARAPEPREPVVLSCGSSTIAWPVEDGTVTSGYGPRGGRNHDGIDVAAPSGTPVRAAACGVVSFKGVQGGYGKMICVAHSSRFSTCSAHLSRFAVNDGDQVRRGQTIGYVGCTGSCTGPHVHFETRVDGRARDPRPYLSGDSTIPGERTSEPERQETQPAADGGSGSGGQAAGSGAEQQSAPSGQQQSGSGAEQQSAPSGQQQSGSGVQQQSAPSGQQQSGSGVQQQSAPSGQQQSGSGVQQQSAPSGQQQSAASAQQQSAAPAQQPAGSGSASGSAPQEQGDAAAGSAAQDRAQASGAGSGEQGKGSSAGASGSGSAGGSAEQPAKQPDAGGAADGQAPAVQQGVESATA